jgi:GNAT superfamily N-acetyltransferase
MEMVDLVVFEPRWLDALVRMWRASFEASVGVIDPHPLADQLRYFVEDVLPQNSVRLALHGDELVGFIACSPVSIAQLYVRVGHQRVGIGTQMLEWAKRRSVGSLWVYTFARNKGARAFYARQGFVEIAYGFEPFWELDDVRLQWKRRAQRPASPVSDP